MRAPGSGVLNFRSRVRGSESGVLGFASRSCGLNLGFEVLGVCRQDPHLKKAAGLISKAWAILEYKCSTDFNGFGKGRKFWKFMVGAHQGARIWGPRVWASKFQVQGWRFWDWGSRFCV